MPIGKFICMLVRENGNNGMILLDLMGKDELVAKMAEKLGQVDLQDKFISAYADIIGHPENHRKFKWVMGNAEGIFL